ncbi:hypothetical protein CKAH01_16775 [Colletotrichum kahawae]|uniref:Uncharacterized protein n=1 Tax=Colletotrichum kahawae TaxID=34407 RepID=A0AAE0D506_COLKA|nr:hypothetical protein CKAH01_16775 [Colletotrichum kahawae]
MALIEAFDKQKSASNRPSNDDRNYSGLPNMGWTASRCRRLLRPLNSRIIALRKISDAENAAWNEGSCRARIAQVNPQPPAKKTKIGNATKSDDLNRRPQRTYSRKASPTLRTGGAATQSSSKASIRAASCSRQDPQSSVPNVPTPILRKVRYHELGETLPATSIREEAATTSVASRFVGKGRLDSSLSQMERLRQGCSLSKYQLYEGILHDLDVLLRATPTVKPLVHKKSLLAMSMRKVPSRAAEIDAWEKLETETDGPVSSIKKVSYSLLVYDELETLGGEGHGWAPLGLLLRAHAIFLLRGAIDDGTLDEKFIRILIHHCKKVGCYQESGDIMEAFLERRFTKARRDGDTYDTNGQGDGLMVVSDLAINASIMPCLLESTSLLLSHGHLHGSTLSTKALGSLWTASASSMLDEQTNPSAIRFASVGLGTLSFCAFGRQRGRKASGSSTREGAAELTLTGMLGALSAMAMISRRFGTAKPVDETTRRVSYVIQEALAFVTSKGGGGDVLYPLLLTSYLASDSTTTAWNTAKSSLKNIWAAEYQSYQFNDQTDKQHSRFHDMTIALTCSVAHCCGKATTGPSSSRYFAAICKLIDELHIPQLATLSSDGAFPLAQKTDDLRDLVFAEALMGASSKQDVIPESLGAAFAGFRWEEGISEWIALSPAAKSRTAVGHAADLSRRSSRDRSAKEHIPVARVETHLPMAATGQNDRRRLFIATDDVMAKPGKLDERRGGWRRAEKRKAPDEPCEDGNVERPRGLGQENCEGKSQLGKLAVKARVGSRRPVRRGETGSRRVLTGLTITGNMTGHGEDDELGL